MSAPTQTSSACLDTRAVCLCLRVFDAKQKLHRPNIAPALGLRAGEDIIDQQVVAVFVAEFTPNPALSTGLFADAIGGGFTMVATSAPFLLTPTGFSMPFDYSWVGEGSLVFSNGH